MKVLTANSLATGEVVFWSAGRWAIGFNEGDRFAGDEDAGPLVDRLQLRRERVELACLGALDQRPVDDVPFLHSAQAAAEGEAAIRRRLARPAALQWREHGIEPAGDVVGRLLGEFRIKQDVGLEGAGDGGLLDYRLAGHAPR